MTAPRLEPLAPADAIAAFDARGRRLIGTGPWTELWQKEHSHAFTVARSAGFDILGDIHDELRRVLSQGATFRDFASELQPKLELKGWWGRTQDGVQLGSMRRLRTIFDANLRVSYAAGAWAAFERTKATRPWLRYVCVLDGRARPEHLARHNLCLRVDDSYWDVWAPPCGWNCRCTLQSLSDRDVDRMRSELVFAPPPDEGTRSFLIRATGETIEVPIGIDPGWAHNPGKAGHRAVVQADKLVAAPPELAAARVASPDWPARPLGDAFEIWARAIDEGRRTDRSAWTIGALDPDVLRALRAAGRSPESAAIVVHQARLGHALRQLKQDLGRAVPFDLMARLPETLAGARAVLLDWRDGSLLYVFDVPAEPRLGKLVLRLDQTLQASAPGETRRSVTANTLRTAGLVPADALRDTTFYEVLKGAV